MKRYQQPVDDKLRDALRIVGNTGNRIERICVSCGLPYMLLEGDIDHCPVCDADNS